MRYNYVQDIRQAFIRKLCNNDYRGNGTIELQNVMFRCDSPVIFGTPNQDYIEAEIEWYKSKDRSVQSLFDIYGKPVKIWDNVKDNYGNVNSQYGNCIWDHSIVSNNSQYGHVLEHLAKDQYSRQAVMYYTPTYIHYTATADGMKDHICTTSVQYFINDYGGNRPHLDCQVNMRSNDAVFGYSNDIAWQKYVLEQLSWDLLEQHNIDTTTGSITWCAGSLHVYERHYNLIKES